MKKIGKAVRLLGAVLREIFDEAAYARFLRRTNLPSSPCAYAAYWREREADHTRKARCC
jgi:hypothetical protein